MGKGKGRGLGREGGRMMANKNLREDFKMFNKPQMDTSFFSQAYYTSRLPRSAHSNYNFQVSQRRVLGVIPDS